MLVLGFWFYSLFILFITILWAIQPPKRPKNYPPGPRRFGFLGSFPNFILDWNFNFFELITRKLAAQYDKVMVFDMGPSPAVMINDIEVLKESFAKNALYGRPPFTPAQPFKETRGFAMRSGDHSKEIQKFTLNALKNFGMGKKTLEPMISEEAEDLVKLLRNKAGEPLSTEHFFNISAFNTLWTILSGERLSLDNYKIHRFLALMKSISQSSLKMVTILAFPNLWKWVPFLFDDAREIQQMARELFMELVEARTLNSKSSTTSSSSESRDDFTSTFVNKIQQTTDPSSAFYGQAAYENAAVTLLELVIGGLETSGLALSWICLYLALHPDKQEKLQKQIDEVLQGETPTLDDKNRLPYVEAVINETLRKTPILPIGVHHQTTEDTTIGGFFVPKDTIVASNIYAIHHSPKTWGDPEIFRPERFLSNDETTLVKHESLVPFCVGKKRCPGEQLSRDTIYLIITRIFREFSIKLNPNEPRPSENIKIKAVLNPPQHTLIFTPRL